MINPNPEISSKIDYSTNYEQRLIISLENLKIVSSQKKTNEIDLAQAHLNCAEILRRMGKINDSKHLYTKSLKIFKNLKDNQGIAWCLWGLASIEGANLNMRKCTNLLNKALTVLHNETTKSPYLWTKSRLSEIDRIQGQLQKSLCEHLVLIESFKSMNDTRGLVWGLQGCGQIYRLLGQNDKSNDFFCEAYMLSQLINDPRGLAYSKKGVAAIESLKGNFNNSKSLYEEALIIFKNLKYDLGTCYTLLGLIEMFYLYGNLHASNIYQQELHEISCRLNDPRLNAYIQLLQGDICRERLEFSDAFAYYEKSLLIFRKGRIKIGLIRTKLSLADLSRLNGENNKALFYLSQIKKLIGSSDLVMEIFHSNFIEFLIKSKYTHTIKESVYGPSLSEEKLPKLAIDIISNFKEKQPYRMC